MKFVDSSFEGDDIGGGEVFLPFFSPLHPFADLANHQIPQSPGAFIETKLSKLMLQSTQWSLNKACHYLTLVMVSLIIE